MPLLRRCFEFFVDADKLTRWLVTAATLGPRPGGACIQVHERGDEGRGWSSSCSRPATVSAGCKLAHRETCEHGWCCFHRPPATRTTQALRV